MALSKTVVVTVLAALVALSGLSVSGVGPAFAQSPEPCESYVAEIIQSGCSGSFNCGLGSCSVAQEITPQSAFTATKLGFRFGGTGAGTVVLSLTSSPGGTVLAQTATLPVLTDGSFTEGPLLSPYDLLAGQTYYLQVDSTIPGTILFCYEPGNPYSYGIAWCRTGAGWSSNNPSNSDYAFVVYRCGSAATTRPKSVGGEAYPVDKTGLLALWGIGVVVLVAGAYVVRRHAHGVK